MDGLDLSYLTENWREVWALTLDHVRLSLLALAIALPIALVLGIAAARFRALTVPVLTFLGILYTIPSQGLGVKPALIILVTYSQVFLVRNIVAGLRSVDAPTLEAASGIGMTRGQVMRRVWFPLALPVIIAGVRTALLTIISIAAVAAWINAGGLGDLLFRGLARNYPAMILAGIIAIIALAAVTDLLLRAAERLTPLARAHRATRR
ncbi:MAG: ABC transporter permease [Chloroflexia bacterium]|nr:ABC transporter permease [Chloroflexia bacterium]